MTQKHRLSYNSTIKASFAAYVVPVSYTHLDLVQLYETKQSIRPGKEQEAEHRAQEVYGEMYSPLLMFDSKKVVFRMLNEDIERDVYKRQEIYRFHRADRTHDS